MLFIVCFRVIFKKQNLVDKVRKLSFNSPLPYNLTPECTGAALTLANCRSGKDTASDQLPGKDNTAN